MLSRLAPVPAPHLPPVPVLSPHGPKVGPFAHASGSPRTPAPAVVAFACGALSLFLLALVLAPAVVEDQPRGAELVGGGAGSGRRLHQFLAPVWYALPTLFDSIYNLGEAIANLAILPEEYRIAAELNAAVAEEGLDEAEAPGPSPGVEEPLTFEEDYFAPFRYRRAKR